MVGLRGLLAREVPELCQAIILVDSPRWPRDLRNRNPLPNALRHECCFSLERSLSKRVPARHQSLSDANSTSAKARKIDVALRLIVATLREQNHQSRLGPLQMFPTPVMSYFLRHLTTTTCKTHLRLLGKGLFGEALNRTYGSPNGGIFTRFMICGFATYQALAAISSNVYESYPDLQFKLWRGNQVIFSKKGRAGRTAALTSRSQVLGALAYQLRVQELPPINHLDAADAAILALSGAAAIRERSTLIIEHPEEGSFLLALTNKQLRCLRETWCS